MPSDSIAGFLDKAQANRVLFPEQVEQLIRQPDIPQTNLDSLCEYLEGRGALTRFQAEMIRHGRGYALSFAGYPVIDEAGPCPGGTAYQALHPSLRTPVELRRFRADALLPADTPAALVGRARAAAGLHHPNLVTLLDAGVFHDEPYATLEPPPDAATLDQLVRDIGPMPGFLAAEYGRQAAAALRAAHERGLAHGDVRPVNFLVGPMTVKTAADGTVKHRPAPNAAIKLAELGLVPLAPPATAAPPPVDVLAYLPPERVDDGTADPRGDLYGLGATLYYLLTGRAPFAGTTPEEMLPRVRSVEPAPLAALRPDLPPAFVAVVNHLLAKRPDQRPPTAFDAEAGLAPFCRHPVAVAIPVATAVAVAPPAAALDFAAEAQPAPAAEWGASDDFTAAATDADAAPPRRRKFTAKEKARTRLMVVLGLILHLSAVALIVAWATGAFNSPPEPEPEPVKKKQEPQTKKKPPQRS